MSIGIGDILLGWFGAEQIKETIQEEIKKTDENAFDGELNDGMG